jgi:hypothetical protein
VRPPGSLHRSTDGPTGAGGPWAGRSRAAGIAFAALVLLGAPALAKGKPAAARPAPAKPAAAAGTVVHYLPFPAGVSYGVWQGNEQKPSHDDVWNKYAFDFAPMAVGSEICATADGVVVLLKEDSTGPTVEALVRRAPDEAKRSALSAHVAAARAEMGNAE